MTTLYKQDARGNMRVWDIKIDGNILTKTYGIVNGEIITHEEEILGNSLRDDEEQAIERMNAKITSKLEHGYCYSEIEARQTQGRNILGLNKPMLAKRDVDFDVDNSLYQYKYNGHRCIIANIGGVKIAYSRNGKPIETIDHILLDMDIPEGMEIDGELYHHGSKLQTISSWIKRQQKNTHNLCFICYDALISENFQYRLDLINSLKLGDRSIVAPTFEYSGSIKTMLDKSIELGYEGLIARPKIGYVYESGKRSSGLIKIKKVFDDEFNVIQISRSKDGWAILHCVTKNGKTFRVSAPGTMQNKHNIWLNRHLFVGRMVNIEYSELTKDGIPFHPVATMFRNKHLE